MRLFRGPTHTACTMVGAIHCHGNVGIRSTKMYFLCQRNGKEMMFNIFTRLAEIVDPNTSEFLCES